MTRLRYNGLRATLGSALSDSATTVTFSAALTHSGGTAVPTIAGGDYIPLALIDATTGDLTEIVHLTAYTTGATSGTIDRAQASTTGVAHADEDLVVNAPMVLDLDLSGYQPLDSDLTAIAALTTTSYGRAFLALANQAALVALLPSYQPLDSDLTAFAAKTAPAGAVVGTTDAQTLTNKTLTSPAIATPTGLVKGDVGLGNVDNTSDTGKPVSTAQAAADTAVLNAAAAFVGNLATLTTADKTSAVNAINELVTAIAGKQASDADLTSIAALTTTSYGRAFLTLANQAALVALLPSYQPLDSDLTSIAALSTTSYGRAFLELANQAALVALLPSYQPLDSDLTAIAALTSAADKVAYATGAGTWALTSLSSFIRTLLDDADATMARATLAVLDPMGIHYQWSTTTTIADPGAGKIRYNSTGTPKIAISTTDVDGMDRSTAWGDQGANLGGAGLIMWRGASGLAFAATAAATNHGTWVEITVAGFSAPSFANLEHIWVLPILI